MSTARRLAPCAISLAIAGATPPGLADDRPLDEIVVRGELREVTLDDATRSVSVLSPGARHPGAISHLEDILGQAANVNFSSGASRARFVQIRGIGERGQFAEPLNASVGLLLDGVDMSGIGTAATLFDIEQVEIFRGPQGTLYGANALAGLINVISRAPSPEFGGSVMLDAGQFYSRGIGVAVTGPLHEKLQARLALRAYRDDGFIDNAFLGRDNTAQRDEETLRGKLRWTPADGAEVDITLGRLTSENGYDNFSLDNNRVTLSDNPGRDWQSSHFGSVQWSVDLAPEWRLIASAGHAKSDIDYGYDEDWTFAGFHADGYSSTDRYQRDRRTSTLDMRLLANDLIGGANGSPGWVLGLFGLTQSVDLERTYTFLDAPYRSAHEVNRVALYGEVDWPLRDALRLRVGLRGERHDAEFTDSDGSRFSPTDKVLGGRIQLEFSFAGDGAIYGGVARGYKAGGFNTDGTLDADLREFAPEVLWNAEIGWRQRWGTGRVSTQASLFYMWRDDVQIDTSIVRERANGSSEFIDFTGNGARGTNAGLEFQVDARLSEGLTIFANLGLLDTAFKDYINGAGADLSGREQAQAPRYQLYAGAEYRPFPRWFTRVDLEARDAYFFSDSHDLRSDAYELVHASLGYESRRWSVKLWVRNLTDEDMPVRGFFFGNDPRDGYKARGFTQPGAPRHAGVTMSVDW